MHMCIFPALCLFKAIPGLVQADQPSIRTSLGGRLFVPSYPEGYGIHDHDGGRR